MNGSLHFVCSISTCDQLTFGWQAFPAAARWLEDPTTASTFRVLLYASIHLGIRLALIVIEQSEHREQYYLLQPNMCSLVLVVVKGLHSSKGR